MSVPAPPPTRSAPAQFAPAPTAPTHAARRLAIGVCLLAALVYLLTYSGVLHAVDEQSALSVAESMLFGHGFHVNQMAWDQGRTPPQNAYGPDGNLYSKKGIGVSLVALPLFALGKLLTPGVGAVQVALLAGTLLTVLSVWAFWGLTRSLGYSVRVAALAALLLALGSPLWPYARTLLSETPGATGLTLALWGMVAWRRAVTARRVNWLLLAGVGLALLVLVKSSNGVVAPVFGLYWLWGVWRRDVRAGNVPGTKGNVPGTGAHVVPATGRFGPGTFLAELAALTAPVILAAAGTVAYNYVRFGTTVSFPLESFEAFSTPLLVGLVGLLFSPGKGIFWYFPALWLGVIFLPHWRRGGRLAEWLLAAGSALASIVLYALWYDWPGGRAWGPRMIITAVPALAMLTLPALDWLVDRHAASDDLQMAGRHSPSHPLTPSPTHLLARSLAIALLTLSFAVQLPGVLVNFERQEELDMQAGATFDQLLWSPAHSPLLTYWGRITTTPDPLWLQPYLRALPTGEAVALGATALCILTAAGGLAVAAWRARQRRGVQLPLVLVTAALLLLLPLLPIVARSDPRWDDQSAVREDNQAMMQSITAEYRSGDLVLLDLLPSSDQGRRSGQWLNFADQPYIGWLRAPTDEMGGEAGARLADWLASYRRVWLLLQATDEGDPASTTEAWLNGWAYSGRRWWVGDQRVVEYLLPLSGADVETNTVEIAGPFNFGDAALLQGYWLEEDADGVRLLLRWQEVGDAGIRYSVQALGPGGVLAQVDGQTALAGNRIGLALPPGVDQLILKLYRAADGSVLRVTDPAASGQPAAEFLPLTRP